MNPEQPGGTKPRKVYTEEFKRSVVDHWISSDKPAAMVAKEFGLNVWNLRDWKRRYHSVAKPVDAPVPKTPTEMSKEIQELRKELARVTMQRDILKKAWAFCRKVRGALSDDRKARFAISGLSVVLGL